MQKIVPVVERLRIETGDQYILAKPRLFVDTAGDLYEHDSGLFIRVRDRQVQMPEIFDNYMKSIDLDEHDSPIRYKVHLGADDAVLYIDPRLNAGRLSFENGTPLFAVVGAVHAGERVADVAEDFGLKSDMIEMALDEWPTIESFA